MYAVYASAELFQAFLDVATDFGIPAVVTVHPSAIVRIRDRDERQTAFDAFVEQYAAYAERAYDELTLLFDATADQKIAVYVYADTAVVSGRVRRSRERAGQMVEDDWRFTKVYVMAQGQWRVVAWHASPAAP